MKQLILLLLITFNYLNAAYTFSEGLPENMHCKVTSVISSSAAYTFSSSEDCQSSLFYSNGTSFHKNVLKTNNNWVSPNKCYYDSTTTILYNCSLPSESLPVTKCVSTDTQFFDSAYTCNPATGLYSKIENASSNDNGIIVCNDGFTLVDDTRCVSGPSVCDDGGPSLLSSSDVNGSELLLCDRTCESVGLVNDNGICKDRKYEVECNSYAVTCNNSCSTLGGVKEFECSNDTGLLIKPCKCNEFTDLVTPTPDPVIPDPDINIDEPIDYYEDPSILEVITPNTSGNSNTLSSSSVTAIKNNDSVIDNLSTTEDLLKSLVKNNTSENSEIDSTLKDTNSRLDLLHNDNNSNFNKLSDINSNLTIGNKSLNNIDNNTKNINSGVTKISDNLDNFGSSFDNLNMDDLDNLNDLDGLALEDKFSSLMDNVSSSYSSLFIPTSYSKPENLTFTIFGTSYILLDFSMFDPYINMIRNLFLFIAYISSFLYFIRSN